MNKLAPALLLLVMAGVVNGVGQVIMRWGGKQATVPFAMSNFPAWVMSSKWWLCGLFLSWTTGLVWALLVKKVPLVIALPVYAGTGYICTLVGSVVALSEKPNAYQAAGTALVLVGIGLIISRS